ncbi:hypothetical protein ACFO0M_21760 [Micromonospora mangrovi]|uniref:DUF732 domain-containing protein n=2 Tax=Micromonospora TaxID=1873 RepID=A0AAU8HBS6_9ACTN
MSGPDLERQVSVALRDLVDGQVPSSPIFDRLADRVRRRRRRRLAGTAAVLVAGAVAATGFLPRPGGGDTAPGAVTPATCPDRDSGQVSNPDRPELSGTLVPDNPAVATICRYHGAAASEPFGTLARSAALSDGAAASLAADLNAGRRLPEGPRSCPMDSGGSIRIIFAYRRGGTVTVRVRLAGCRTASNGRTELLTSQPTQQQLRDLVGRP